MTRRVVVIGGGITGLAAAHRLSQADDIDVTLVETDDRLGGKILTTPFAGRPVDEGADAFLLRVPWALDLCEELGLAGELVSPAARTAYVWSRGELRPLPDGHVLGVPTDLDALAASGVVSPEGLARAAVDLAGGAPAIGPGEDPAIGAVVRERLGDEVAERLVDPLVGGINAGDTDRLSLAACVPQLDTAARAAPSLIAALRAQLRRATVDPEIPVFATHPAGMGHLVDRLAAALGDAGVDVRLATTATLEPGPGPCTTVHLTPTPGLVADGVVVATPAPAAATLVRPLDTDAAELLAGIDHASVALVTLAVPTDAVGRPLDASGFLVPRVEGLAVTACSWASTKWAHLAGDSVVLRASVGRDGDTAALDLDDTDLVDRVLDDLDRTMGLSSAPTEQRVSRWPSGFPQYRPGHLARVTEVERLLAEAGPTVAVTGAAFRGLGIPACIRQGRDAADRILAR